MREIEKGKKIGEEGGDLKYLFLHLGEPHRMERKPKEPGLELTEKELLSRLVWLHGKPFLCLSSHSAEEVKSQEII